MTVRMRVLQNGRLSDFQRQQTVGARLASASVNKEAILLGVSRAAVSKAMTANTNHGKTSSTKRNTDRKPERSERDRCTLRRLPLKIIELLQQRWQQNSVFIFKTLFPQKQSEESFTNPASTVELQFLNLWLLKTKLRGKKRWCGDHKIWTSDDWKYVIWSDESSFTLLPTSHRVYVWKTPKETYNPECLIPAVKNGGGSVIWAAISWYAAGPIITMNDRITASDYVDILGNQEEPTVQMLPNNDAIFQDNNSPIHSARNVQSWLEEHEDAIQHLPWPSQSPDLNIRATVVRFRKYRENQIPFSIISQATRRCSSWRVIHYSSRDYPELINMSPFQEGYKLYYRQMMAQLCIN